MVRKEREREETRKNPEEWTGMIDCSEIQEEGGVTRRVDRNDRLFLKPRAERRKEWQEDWTGMIDCS